MTDTGWDDDEQIWTALDEFVAASWLPLKELLDCAFEHQAEYQPVTSALLFGGLGTFVRVYHERRSESNSPQQAFIDAMQSVQADRRVQSVFQTATESAIDNKINRMGGE